MNQGNGVRQIPCNKFYVYRLLEKPHTDYTKSVTVHKIKQNETTLKRRNCTL